MHGTKRTKPGLSAIRKAVMVLVLGGGCSPQCSVPASSDGDAGACLACDGGTVSVCYNRCLPVVSTGGLCLVDPCGTTTGPTGAGVCGGAVDDGGQHKPLRCVPDSDAGMESNVGHCEEGALGELQMGCTNDSDCDHGTKCVTGTCSYPSGSQTLTLTGFCRHGSGEGAACSADNPCLACAPGLTCVGGHCVRACVPSAAVGTVGACACAGESCVSTNNGGVCCPPGSNAVCRGACTNTMVDVGNCGGCGTVCTAGANASAACTDGACRNVCTPGYTNCGGTCVDITSDPANCGGCGVAVPVAPNAVVGCMHGMPRITGCSPTFLDCDGRLSDGCEIDSQSDVNNCGGCRHSCTPLPNSTPTCVNGVCPLVCTMGFADCDHRLFDGCEANLNNGLNCGSCGIVCGGMQSCVSMTCENNYCAPAHVSCLTGPCCYGLHCDAYFNCNL